MRKRRLIASIAAIGALSQAPLAEPALATTKTATMAVSMTVIAGCSNLTATSLAFPITVAAGSSQIPTATGSVTATCSSGVTALLGFNAGANVSGTVTVPVLKGPGTTGSQTIAYGIYSDSAFGTPFPAVTAPTTTPAGGTTITGGAAFPVTVYGQIGANTAGATVSPTIAAGAYTDTLTATIYF